MMISAVTTIAVGLFTVIRKLDRASGADDSKEAPNLQSDASHDQPS